VWAVGVDFALLLAFPFLGWYAGRRSPSFRGFVGQLFATMLLQRIVLVAIGYFATTRALGTHLDTHVVTDMHMRPLPEVTFVEDPVKAWLHTTAIPQLSIALVMTTVMGIVLGSGPFLLARRRE